MCVVVQEMVEAEAAGVVFTADPVAGSCLQYCSTHTVLTAQVTGEEGRLTVTANWGLGESVVSGLADPDTLTLDTETGAILTYNIGAKRVRWQTK